MAHANLGGGDPSEIWYDRADYAPSDNLLDVNIYGSFTTTQILNTDHPAATEKTLSLEINKAYIGSATHTVNMSEGTNVYLTALKYEASGGTYHFNLGVESSLTIRGGDGLYHMLTSDETFNFNFSEDGPSTLKFENLEFLPQASYPNAPMINGFGQDDTLIINDAKVTEFSNGQLIFKDAEGKIVLQLNAPNVDESLLRFGTDETGAMTVSYACYLKGTHIATPDGETKVEDLKAGDQVLTASGGIAKVKWLGYRTLYKNSIPEKDAKRAFPILFKKGCIADNVPHRDLVMSPGHHVFFDGNLVPAMVLVNGISIVQQFEMQSFQYFHVELEQFDILVAEGVPAESYVDCGNRNMFQNAHEVAMNPDFGPAEGRPDVPGVAVVRKGPVVEAIRAKLLERANWMQVPEARKRVG